MGSWSQLLAVAADSQAVDELDMVLARLRSEPDDEAAWGQFVLVTGGLVHALGQHAVKSCRRQFDAEDITQQVYCKFVRCWRSAPVASPAPKAHEVRTLLAIITARTARDVVRSLHKARRDIARETSAADDELPAAGSMPADDVLMSELLEYVSRQLFPDQRQILVLRLQGFTVAEIAESLGWSVRTVERRLASLTPIVRQQLLEEM